MSDGGIIRFCAALLCFVLANQARYEGRRFASRSLDVAAAIWMFTAILHEVPS